MNEKKYPANYMGKKIYLHQVASALHDVAVSLNERIGAAEFKVIRGEIGMDYPTPSTRLMQIGPERRVFNLRRLRRILVDVADVDPTGTCVRYTTFGKNVGIRSLLEPHLNEIEQQHRLQIDFHWLHGE